MYFVYILASERNGVLYIGVTNDLVRRVYGHKHDLAPGFTKEHQVHMLVYYEQTSEIESAIKREKDLKKWKRSWKMRLIETKNSDWKDLCEEIT